MDQIAEQSVYTADYVKSRLTSAGMTLMSLPASGTMPARYRVAWPEIVRSIEDIIGAEPDDRPRIPRASAASISDMDEVLFNAGNWISLLGPAAVMTRRLVLLRCLVKPWNGHHVWSYGKLEKVFGLERQALMARHLRGVERIVTLLNCPGWIAPRGSHLP